MIQQHCCGHETTSTTAVAMIQQHKQVAKIQQQKTAFAMKQYQQLLLQ